MFACLQPIMFVVLFVYVFGGSITVPGYSDYKQFVIPGIFAQTVLFGSIYTGLGIAEDLTRASSTGCARCRCTRRRTCSAAP